MHRGGLREYQREVVDSVKKYISSGARSVLIVAPTGSGKTKMVASIIKETNRVPLAIAHRVEICNQIRNQFRVENIDRYWVNGILSSDTLRMAYNENVIDTIFIDEAHHMAANKYQEVIKQRGKKILIGATATPYRLDGASIVGNFDAVVYSPTHENLVSLGYLSPTTFVSAIDINFDEVKLNIRGDYEEKGCLDKLRIVIHAGDIPKQLKEHACSKGTLIYGVNIEHCTMIDEELKEHGLSSVVLTSRTPKKLRTQIVKDFENGLVDYIVNCEVLTEGADIKRVSNIVMVRPTRSLVMYKQMIGRGVRPDTPNKVIDLVGNVNRFGDVFSSHEWKRDKGTLMAITSASAINPNSAILLHVESVKCNLKHIVPIAMRKFLHGTS